MPPEADALVTRVTQPRARWSNQTAAVVVVVWFLLNGVWVLRQLPRSLNIDEAGYLAMAVNAADSWWRGGFGAWWGTVTFPSAQAPLVPALTSLPVIAGMDPTRAGLLVILVFGAVALVFTWLLARDIAGRGVAWLSLLFVATAPGVLRYGHLFMFVVPTMALLTGAVWTLGRSRAMTRWPWSVAFGVMVGLLPLTRSMCLAFAAVLVVVAVLQVAAAGWRRAAALQLVAASLLAVALTSTWLVPSWAPVIHYLTGYGYGRNADEYASTVNPVISVAQVLSWSLYAPLTILVVLGWMLALVGRLPVGASARLRVRPRAVALSTLFPPAAVALGGLAALCTTKNVGAGFGLQLLGPIAVIAAVGWCDLVVRPRRWVSGSVLVIIVVLCSIPVPGLVTRSSPWGELRTVPLPLLGRVNVTSGVEENEQYGSVLSAEFQDYSDWTGEWEHLAAQIGDEVAPADTAARPVAFGFRGMQVNVNTVQLSLLERRRNPVPMIQIDPQVINSTERDYRDWLERPGAAGAACYLVTSAGTVNEFRPLVDSAALANAALESGFIVRDSIPSPDGRVVQIWHRQNDVCGPG